MCRPIFGRHPHWLRCSLAAHTLISVSPVSWNMVTLGVSRCACHHVWVERGRNSTSRRTVYSFIIQSKLSHNWLLQAVYKVATMAHCACSYFVIGCCMQSAGDGSWRAAEEKTVAFAISSWKTRYAPNMHHQVDHGPVVLSFLSANGVLYAQKRPNPHQTAQT